MHQVVYYIERVYETNQDNENARSKFQEVTSKLPLKSCEGEMNFANLFQNTAN